MAKTVEEGFNQFHTTLTPSTVETEAAKSHRASIKACLENKFGMTRFVRTGSFGNGTSIRNFSDVDYFAEIPTVNLKKNSATTLTQVRNALDTRFPNTGVRVSTPGVVVPFGKDASETTEVIPADLVGKHQDKYPLYEIADGNEGWMNASPEAHNAYVTYVNGKFSGKVKPLIRFLKAWKFYQNVPILSFYLELRVAKYASGEDTIIYSTDVRQFLKLLVDNELAGIQDPMGVSGTIYPCSTKAKKDDALSKLDTAFSRADKAKSAESAGKISEAFYWWNLLYGGKFPAFG